MYPWIFPMAITQNYPDPPLPAQYAPLGIVRPLARIYTVPCSSVLIAQYQKCTRTTVPHQSVLIALYPTLGVLIALYQHLKCTYCTVPKFKMYLGAVHIAMCNVS